MAGERTFLQVPPDSTGKRVRMTHTAEVFYNSLSPSGYSWEIGARYYVDFEDNSQYYIHVHGYHAITATTGVLEVHYAKSPRYNNLNPKVGATIYEEDLVTARAVVQSVRDVFINSNHIIGFDNPEYGVDVDPTGSMNVRFAEGLPQLDAFGKLRTSGATVLGDYTFSQNTLPSDFTKTFYGRSLGVAIGHDEIRRALKLTTPDTSQSIAAVDPMSGVVTEFNSQVAQITSNTYHHYFPGFSHMAIMTVALEDADGKAGVGHKWGYWDDKNGYYFQAVDGRGLEFVIRSSAISSGSYKEIVIGRNTTTTTTYTDGVAGTPSVITDGWNGDPVDGQGDSKKLIDLSNDNIYWLDIQWLGAGRVRFGTYHKGQRIVIHEYYHDDNNGYPHSQTASLPIRFQQYNLAGQIVDSATTMRVWCASVVSEAAIQLDTQGKSYVESFEVTFDPDNLNDFKGLNDTGKGDRLGVIKTGVSTTGTTMTVPNVIGIKPGYSVEMVNGTGELDHPHVSVLEITDSTTIVLSASPTVDLVSAEVRFHMNVDHEYHLIGLLSPVTYLGTQTVNKNRTLFLPKASQAWAYHETTGADAFVEIEVYVQPIVSGNNKSITTPSDQGGALIRVERNDPFAGAESYQFNDGLVNYFGSGYHNQITFVKGRNEPVDLTGQFANYQSGAFKLLSDNGGNNRCPIARVYQSPAAGVATVIQINTAPTGVEFTLHRENETALYFDDIPGAIGAELNQSAGKGPFYVRHLDIEKLELYHDQLFTNPVDTSQATAGIDPSLNTGGTISIGAGTETVSGGLTWRGNEGSIPTGGWIISGYGDQLHFAIVAKPVGPSADTRTLANDGVDGYATLNGAITCHFRLNWTEINQ